MISKQLQRSLKLAIGAWVVGMVGLGVAFLGYEVIGRLVMYPALIVGAYGVISGMVRLLKEWLQ